MNQQNKPAVVATQNWINNVVIDLNLCPFAQREFVANKIRYTVSDAQTDQQLGELFVAELFALDANEEFETSLLIVESHLEQFSKFNQFIEVAEYLIQSLGFEEKFQLASFHPEYQFADVSAESVENYTNRSPYPVLHILRCQSVAKAIESYGDTSLIPHTNVQTMSSLGLKRMQTRLRECRSQDDQI